MSIKLENMKTEFSYMVVKHNQPHFERESTLLHNKHKKTAKYAIFNKSCHKDGSESVNFIEYSSSMEEIQNKINGFESWYNYPLGIAKLRNGKIRLIS